MGRPLPNAWRAPQWLLYFLGFWFVLNLAQAYFTELFNDEALYWAFAQRLDWGYFDHPPMTAALIAITDFIPGEVGVRLMFVLMSTATVYLLWFLTQATDRWLFMSLIVGTAILHIGGFFAAPDVPLVFLVAAFLAVYKYFFYEENQAQAILMGFLMGLMAWSKYHAILFAIALVLSNVELLRRKSFYLMVGVAILTILPHIYWQYLNDWVTFEFHLFERRGEKPWHFGLVGEYLGGQLLLFGPLLGLFLFPAVAKFQQRDHYDCALKYLFFVVLIFFLLQSFRGRVEANWTAMIMPSMVYFGYLFYEKNQPWRTWLIRAAGVSFVLVIALRIFLAFDVFSEKNNPRNETHGFKAWAEKIAELAGERPVVFINNYRKPAKYAFYTGKTTYDWNMAEYSGNQYDLWIEDELALQGKDVLVVSNELISGDSITFSHGIQSERYRSYSPYYSYNYMELTADFPEEVEKGQLEPEFEVTITNPTAEEVTFQDGVQMHLLFYRYEIEEWDAILLPRMPIRTMAPGQSVPVDVSFRWPEKSGKFKAKIALFYNDLPGLNSPSYRVKVK